MQRKAFTLVELLISVFLLGLIVNFLYTAVDNLQRTNTLFHQKSDTLQNKQKIFDLLYDDLFSAQVLKITGRKNSTIDMKTRNSIYDIESPYVTWLLHRENNTLLRFESTKPFSDMRSDTTHFYHISKVGKDCERFKIYQSNNHNTVLVHIKFKDQEPIIFEFFKPM
ncbi:MAG: prepilin-type N-terminal cleavage/methylation domain-containing protein [Epsilonproteobacteria bacterium]|nr:prepilin-type N-terminal cleavage/methylation domain-containing protein [Campylobacterota bacterium]